MPTCAVNRCLFPTPRPTLLRQRTQGCWWTRLAAAAAQSVHSWMTGLAQICKEAARERSASTVRWMRLKCVFSLFRSYVLCAADVLCKGKEMRRQHEPVCARIQAHMHPGALSRVCHLHHPAHRRLREPGHRQPVQHSRTFPSPSCVHACRGVSRVLSFLLSPFRASSTLVSSQQPPSASKSVFLFVHRRVFSSPPAFLFPAHIRPLRPCYPGRCVSVACTRSSVRRLQHVHVIHCQR